MKNNQAIVLDQSTFILSTSNDATWVRLDHVKNFMVSSYMLLSKFDLSFASLFLHVKVAACSQLMCFHLSVFDTQHHL